MVRWFCKTAAPARVGVYGHFGVGNLGNEATLQAVIERIRQYYPDGQLLCFCTNPRDVRARHNITAVHSEAIEKKSGSGRRKGSLDRLFRTYFRRAALELVHWVKCLRTVRRMDMLIVAGTGVVSDYLTGPLGWPYDIFKLSVLASLCRVKLVFLSIGAGPIRHPLSRWFLKSSLALAHHRSYRDEASKHYLQSIGFNTDRDSVYADVVFGLPQGDRASAGQAGQRRVVGLGIKDFGSSEPEISQEYLETMATFVSWLQARDYSVRLLIGDIQYDIPVIDRFIDILRRRNIPSAAPMLIAEPALTVEELLRQVSETDAVISARYHNLVIALTQGKPIIALSDHGKLESLATDYGLAQYLLPLHKLRADVLIERFEQLEAHAERLRSDINAQLERYRQALDGLYAILLVNTRTRLGSSGRGRPSR